METCYRVFRYRGDDPQCGARGTGVTIKDGLQNANWVGAFRDGYLEALLGAGWDYYDQLAATNPAGEHWIFTFESYPVEQCCQCGAYVPAWWMDKDQQPWCVGCLGEMKIDKGELDFVLGIWKRMVRARDEYGPYIGTWPADWETREVDQASAVTQPEPAGSITLEHTITARDLCDVLCTAFDGAYGSFPYWVHKMCVASTARRTGGYQIEYSWEHAAFDGVLLIQTEPSDEVGYILSRSKLLKGIERAAREGRFQLREGWPGDVDAEVADVIVQYALFGEIVYG